MAIRHLLSLSNTGTTRRMDGGIIMRHDQFHNMMGASDDEEEEEEVEDLSGFMSASTPSVEAPKVTTRPRGGTGGPKSTAGPAPNPNLGYVSPRAFVQEDEDSLKTVFIPWQAHDDSIWGGPKTSVGLKTLGSIAAVPTLFYLIGQKSIDGWKGGSKLPSRLLMAQLGMYLQPVIGWNHGIFKGVDTNWQRYACSVAGHVGTMSLFVWPFFRYYKERR